MGKWTVDYYDDVLGAKLKRLVSGAIKRSNLEKEEPAITYEAFIEELDEGDGFTASLFDLLIKEVADRRARPSSYNRHLIADQTAAGLRLLASPSRIYRERPRSIRRTRNYNLSEYLADAPETPADEDEFDTLLDSGTTAVEGTRIDSELYYAPATSYPSYETVFTASSRRPRSSQSNTAASTVGDDNSERFFPETMVSRSPPSLHTQLRSESRTSAYSRSNHPAYHPSGLSRQATIRRPLRSSRTTDFNDFTSLRRILRRSDSLENPEHSRPPTSEPSSLSNARRFFPVARPRSHEINSFPWQFGSVENHSSDTPYESPPDPQPENIHLHPPQESLLFNSSLTLPSIESYQRPPVHRLRRGGVGPPEVLQSRRFQSVLGDEPSERGAGVESAAGAEDSFNSPRNRPHSLMHDSVDSVTHEENSERYI